MTEKEAIEILKKAGHFVDEQNKNVALTFHIEDEESVQFFSCCWLVFNKGYTITNTTFKE